MPENNVPENERFGIKALHPESDSSWMLEGRYATRDAARTVIETLEPIDNGHGTYTIWDFLTDKEDEVFEFKEYDIDIAIYEYFFPSECPWYLRGVSRSVTNNSYRPGNYSLHGHFTEDGLEGFQEWCWQHGGMIKVIGITPCTKS